MDAQRGLPETITAGGVTRWLTRHVRDELDPGVTTDRIRHVLENWAIRGICKDSRGDSETVTYWGLVSGRQEMLRVVVSLDDQEIITAHFDDAVVKRIEEAGRPWFQRRCRDLEVRDAG